MIGVIRATSHFVRLATLTVAGIAALSPQTHAADYPIQPVPLAAVRIPYYAWANRAPAEMTVWFARETNWANPVPP
jgi:DUF1680 family protein